MMIRAESARDATGKAVPTSLAVVAPNIVELTVAHKGGGFIYPVSAGPAFEVGYSSVVVTVPPPPVPPVGEGFYWETSDLQVSAPEASASSAGWQEKQFVRVICGHYALKRPNESFIDSCGNPFTFDTGSAVTWHAAMRGAYWFKPGKEAEQRGVKACGQRAYQVSVITAYYVAPNVECHYDPKTSDGNGGAIVSAGNYLRAQVRWPLWGRSLCAGATCPGDPPATLIDEKALEMHLWPSGAVQRTVP
jgi:hypothetical protein